MPFSKKIQLARENTIPTLDKRLSISLRTHGFSFSVKDTKDNLLQIADYDFLLPETMMEQMNLFRSVFAENQITTFGFRQIEIIYPSTKHVWVPYHLFDAENLTDYLRFVATLDSKENVLTHFSQYLNAHSIFAIPQNLHSSLKVLMPSAKFQSQHTALLDKALPLVPKDKAALFVNIRQKEVDILVFKEGKFLLSNTFSYQNETTEILYFVLNILRQLKLAPETAYCYLSGITENSLLNHFRSFIPLSYFIPQPAELGESFETLLAYNYFIIL